MPETEPLTAAQERELREFNKDDHRYPWVLIQTALATIDQLRADCAGLTAKEKYLIEHLNLIHNWANDGNISGVLAEYQECRENGLLVATPNPGQALLDKLRWLDEDVNNLQVEVRARTTERDTLTAENARLRERLEAAEVELQRHRELAVLRREF